LYKRFKNINREFDYVGGDTFINNVVKHIFLPVQILFQPDNLLRVRTPFDIVKGILNISVKFLSDVNSNDNKFTITICCNNIKNYENDDEIMLGVPLPNNIKSGQPKSSNLINNMYEKLGTSPETKIQMKYDVL
jgi:hypothetical protein